LIGVTVITTYMYWNNPIVKITELGQPSPDHQLFYVNNVPINLIRPQLTLSTMCAMINNRLENYNKSEFTQDPALSDIISNIVKINQMVTSLKQHGCVKPMLLHYCGSMPMISGTGDSRLKALECVSDIISVPAIISTHQKYRLPFEQYQHIQTLDQLKHVCGVTHSEFYFQFTDQSADYGVEWFEYENDTVPVPDTSWCLTVIQNYIDLQSSTFRFSKTWFENFIDWQLYS